MIADDQAYSSATRACISPIANLVVDERQRLVLDGIPCGGLVYDRDRPVDKHHFAIAERRRVCGELAVPDPERAPLVREMFERYTTGHESDRSLADWLNAKGARTARDRQFGKDTVREMLCNAAYAGYVSGLRDKTRAIQGLHEAIITDELFEKVQEIRSWRTRVVKPGRPSEEYLLRKLLCCERCGARMHGTRGSRAGIRRYQYSTRRHHGNCQQAIVKAEPLEEQLVTWLHAFQPDNKLRDLVLDTIRSATQQHPGQDQDRRRELLVQLERLQDLYVLGDLTKPRYIMRRQTLEEELQRLAPPADPELDRAQELLGDFARFWHAEPSPQAPRQPVRPHLARQRPDRRRQTTPSIRPLLQGDTPGQTKSPESWPGTRRDNTGGSGRAANLDLLLGQLLEALLEPVSRKARKRAAEAIRRSQG